MKFSSSRFVRLLSCALLSAPFPLVAQTTNTWDGGGSDGLFSTAANWVGDVAPGATMSNAGLVFAGTANLNVTNNVVTNYAFASNSFITFADGAGSFNVASTGAFVNTNGGGNVMIVAQKSANAQTISANWTFNGGTARDQQIGFATGAGALTLSGNINFNSSFIYMATNNAFATNNGTLAAGNLILTGTNTGAGRGGAIASTNVGVATNQFRATVDNRIASNVITIGSDRALGNASTAANDLRGVIISADTTINTIGERNLTDYYFGSGAQRLFFGSSNNLTIGGIIMNNTGNFTRDVQVTNSGVVTVASNFWLSSGLTNNAGTYLNLTNGGRMVVNGRLVDTFNISGSATGTNTLRKAGDGVLELNGDSGSTFTGIVQLENGTIKLGSANALGATNNYLLVNSAGGTLDLNGQTVDKMITNTVSTFTLANSAAGTATLSTDMNFTTGLTVSNAGNIDAQRLIGYGIARTITKIGSGTLTAAGTNHNSFVAWVVDEGTVNLANTSGRGADRGVTINNGGTLMLSGSNSDLINNTQDFTVNAGGTFNLNGKSEATASIGGTGGVVRNGSASAATLFVGGGSAGTSSASWGGTIEDGVGVLNLAKEGTGTQTLTGTSTYSGTTQVRAGELALGATAGLTGSSGITISNGAVFNVSALPGGFTTSPGQSLGGLGSVLGNINLSGGILAPGGAIPGALAIFGNLSAPSGSVLSFNVVNATNYDSVSVGDAAISGQVSVTLDPAYTPQVGDLFTLVSASGARSGSPTFNLPSPGSGLAWFTNNFSTTGVLSITNGSTNGYATWISYWQTQNPAFTTNTAPADDFDKDGFSNGAEFAFDGNPTVGTPALLKASRSGNDVVVSFVAADSQFPAAYSVLVTTNLNTGPFVATNVIITNSLDQSGVLLPGEYKRREFRVPASGNTFFRVEADLAQ